MHLLQLGLHVFTRMGVHNLGSLHASVVIGLYSRTQVVAEAQAVNQQQDLPSSCCRHCTSEIIWMILAD